MPSVRPGSAAGDGAVAGSDHARVAALIGDHRGRGEDLIEVLHVVQQQLGHLPAAALRQVAGALELPLSHVFGVASFYHLFHLEPPPAHRCGVCLGTACVVRGAAELADRLQARLGLRIDDHRTSEGWRLEGVSCQGACGLGPLLLLDGRLVPALPFDCGERLQSHFDAIGLPAAGGTGS